MTVGSVTKSQIIIFIVKFFLMAKFYLRKFLWEAAKFISICGRKSGTDNSEFHKNISTAKFRDTRKELIITCYNCFIQIKIHDLFRHGVKNFS